MTSTQHAKMETLMHALDLLLNCSGCDAKCKMTRTMLSLQHSAEHLVYLEYIYFLLPAVTRPVGQSRVNHQMILIQVVTKKSRNAINCFFFFF